MSKILEKVIYKRVMSFLTQQKFFYDGQFGFRKKHGTSHAVTWLVEAYENKQLFLDLSKEFDTIDRTILFQKLQYMALEDWHVIGSVVIYVDDLNSFNWAILYLIKDCYSMEFPKVQ